MATGAVRKAADVDVDRRRVLLPRRYVHTLITVVALVAWVSCAPLTRLRPYDPQKDFAYGQIEHQEPGELMVVTRATLESHGEDKHGLLLDTTVDPSTAICVHKRVIPAGGAQRAIMICVPMARLQDWMEANAPTR